MIRSRLQKDAMGLIQHNYQAILNPEAEIVITSHAGCYKTLT